MIFFSSRNDVHFVNLNSLFYYAVYSWWHCLGDVQRISFRSVGCPKLHCLGIQPVPFSYG